MVFSAKFGLKPVMPNKMNKLYQGIIKSDGVWRTPTGPNVEFYVAWKSSFEAPNKYRIDHDIKTSHVSIQIDMREPTCSHVITAIDENGFTIETRDASGNPAPCEWKFQLRANH